MCAGCTARACRSRTLADLPSEAVDSDSGWLAHLESEWSPALGPSMEALNANLTEGRLDIGCVAAQALFFYDQASGVAATPITKSRRPRFFSPIAQLSSVGNGPHDRWEAYGQRLTARGRRGKHTLGVPPVPGVTGAAARTTTRLLAHLVSITRSHWPRSVLHAGGAPRALAPLAIAHLAQMPVAHNGDAGGPETGSALGRLHQLEVGRFEDSWPAGDV